MQALAELLHSDSAAIRKLALQTAACDGLLSDHAEHAQMMLAAGTLAASRVVLPGLHPTHIVRRLLVRDSSYRCKGIILNVAPAACAERRSIIWHCYQSQSRVLQNKLCNVVL